jgi:hypothetical protein
MKSSRPEQAAANLELETPISYNPHDRHGLHDLPNHHRDPLHLRLVVRGTGRRGGGTGSTQFLAMRRGRVPRLPDPGRAIYFAVLTYRL